MEVPRLDASLQFKGLQGLGYPSFPTSICGGAIWPVQDVSLLSTMAPSEESESTSLKHQPRRPRINPERLERKRATDRETQRAIRAKTKSYIEHLEATVQRYEQLSGDELTRNLAATVSEQHSEIVRLQGIMKNATKMLEAAVGSSTGPEDLRNHSTDSSLPEATEQRKPSVTLPAMHNPATSSTSLPEMHPNPSNNLNLNHSNGVAEVTIDQPMPSSRNSFENPLACGEESGNYFGILSSKLSSIQSDTSFLPLTSAEEDEDVAVRAVLKGWQDVLQRHQLDSAWKILQATDQGLFYRSGPVERVGVLKVMRSMLLYKINPFWNHPTPRLPSYMMPGQDQITSPHPSLVDFFVWPQLRRWLIAHNITYIPEYAASLFATSLRFRWQYEPRDVYATHKKTGRYLLSQAFKQSLEDLSSWTLDEKFFSFGGGLVSILPASSDYDDADGLPALMEIRNSIISADGNSVPNLSGHPDQGTPTGVVPNHTVLSSNIDLDGYHAPVFGPGNTV